LKDSKEFLEKNLGVPVTSFAYPYGTTIVEIEKATKEAGYVAAVTVSPQKTSWDTDLFKSAATSSTETVTRTSKWPPASTAVAASAAPM